jgi:hypothetical protein
VDLVVLALVVVMGVVVVVDTLEVELTIIMVVMEVDAVHIILELTKIIQQEYNMVTV